MKLNYFNFDNRKDLFFLTNDFGYYCYLNKEDFQNLLSEKYDQIVPDKQKELLEKYFIYEEDEAVFAEKTVIPYRDSKYYTLQGTSLHIFVMTNACNMNCVYCQAQDSEQLDKGKMSMETAERAVDIALQTPVRRMTFEFQGGEPLTNFDVIKHIVQYSQQQCNDKEIEYCIVTNTLLLTEEMITFLRNNGISISTSLDGNEIVHDNNRKTVKGTGTFLRYLKI